jgi:GNAT superfamily N-acetyltransferase
MSAGNVTIRRAELGDAPEMARLAAELGYPASPSEMRERLERLLPESRHHVVVGSGKSGRLSGWMHVEHRTSIEGGDRAELVGLVVDSTARRVGIGRELIEVAERWASAKGLPHLTVRSNTERRSSHPFYESMGFRCTKTQHVYVRITTGKYGKGKAGEHD